MADKSEVIEVTAFSGVNDRNGKPSWKLTANVSWSNYAIEYLEWPKMDGESAFTLGTYQAGSSTASDTKKDRSMAISYAKDLCCADKIERGEVFEVAAKILAFIEDGPEAVQEEIDWQEQEG